LVENISLSAILRYMKKLMTKHFSRWAAKQKIPKQELANALTEVLPGTSKQILAVIFIKKAPVLRGKAKAVVCEPLFVTKKAIGQFLFMVLLKMKNRNLSKKELIAFKELSKILLRLTPEEITIAIDNKDLIEVKS